MDTTTLGIFHYKEEAEEAINELSRNGFLSKDILIVAKERGKVSRIGKTPDSILLCVPTASSNESLVRQILEKFHGDHVKTITNKN